MSVWRMRPEESVLEATTAFEAYIEDVTAIEESNGNWRVSLHAQETPVDVPDAKPHRMVKVKLIGPIGCFGKIAARLLECSSADPAPNGDNVVTLVR